MRPTRLEVDLCVLADNFSAIAQAVAPARVMAVVKANAYGHGLVPVARCLQDAGARHFGVAIVEEALLLREAGVRGTILVLGPWPPRQAEELVAAGISCTVYEPSMLRVLGACARRLGRPARVHLKFDTGMGRLGVRSASDLVALATAAVTEEGVVLEGVFTHFSDAEARDDDFTRGQIAKYAEGLDALRAAGIAPGLRHACNSAGILRHPEAHFDLVRPGLLLYGYHPSEFTPPTISVRPALRWRAEIGMLKELPPGEPVGYGRTYYTSRPTRVATVGVGYADGYRRALSNRGQCLVGGRRCRVIGRVCMDQIMVDVTGVEGVKVGDEVVLLGRQGDEEVTAPQLAALCDTAPHEILTGIGQRVPRIYRYSREL